MNYSGLAWIRSRRALVIACCIAASAVYFVAFLAVDCLSRPEKLDRRDVAAVEARQAEIEASWKAIEAMVAPPRQRLAAIEQHQLLVDTLPEDKLAQFALRKENLRRNSHPYEIKDSWVEGNLLVVDLYFPTAMYRPTHRAVLTRTDHPGYERYEVVSFEMITNDYLESEEGKMYARLNDGK